MDGPRVKRSRLDSFQQHETIFINLEDEDDDIFVVPAVQRASSSAAPHFPSKSTACSTSRKPSQRKPPLRSQKSLPAKSGKSPKQQPRKRASERTSINQSTLQTTLNDFFRPTNSQLDVKPVIPQPVSSLQVESSRTFESTRRHVKLESEISRAEQSINQPLPLPAISQLDQTLELFPDLVDDVTTRHNLAIEDALQFLESDNSTKTFDSLEENDSSGDEWLANLPDDVLAEQAIAPVFLPKFACQRPLALVKPTSSGQFKNQSGRQCPFYKIMPSTPFSVDAFNFGYVPNVTSYFLSHFHSDHYVGLTSKFQQPLYCSRITANLVRKKIGVNEYWMKEIPMNSPYVVDGVELTLLDANHCPGSCLFLFKLRNGQVYLHTGDFRADPEVMGKDPALKNLREVSKLYLDTTYLDPYYEFESQAATVEFAAEFARQTVARNSKTLICCGTYSVGKEKIFIRIAEVLKSKVAVTAHKLQLMECFEWKHFESLLTKDWNRAQVHVMPMQALNVASLADHLQKHRNFNAILAIVPSGWQFSKKNVSLKDIKPKVSGAVSILGLPYSEHSSYRELEWFVRFIKPKQVIPTVSVGNPKRRKEMEAILNNWLDPSYKPPVVKKQNLITSFFGV